MTLMTIMRFLRSSSERWAHKVLWGKNVTGSSTLRKCCTFSFSLGDFQAASTGRRFRDVLSKRTCLPLFRSVFS